MSALLKISLGVDWISERLGRIASVAVLLTALISEGNAFVRYLLDISSNGWLEIQWYLFAGIVMGLQLFYRMSKIGIVFAIVRAIATWILLSMGYGVITLAVMMFVGSIVNSLILYRICLEQLPFLSILTVRVAFDPLPRRNGGSARRVAGCSCCAPRPSPARSARAAVRGPSPTAR